MKTPTKPDVVHTSDVLAVGGGPAGMAAACSAAESGLRVCIVDDNPHLGGQIWRADAAKPAVREAAAWFERLKSGEVTRIAGARVFHRRESGELMAETSKGVCLLRYRRLILATGARERFLPFPGWTLPNVCGAGGLQALVKGGLPVSGKKVVVAGSGPLLLAVAAYLRKRGANVRLVAEQASMRDLFRFGFALLAQPRKILHALELKSQLRGVPIFAGCWPVAALGEEKLSGVTLRQGRRTWNVECDYLACGFHLVPNLELAELLGCETQNGVVRIHEFQDTSMPGVYCAGELTGIGGLELSLVEGRIAGYASADLPDRARSLFSAREKLRRFARVLDRTFALRDELKALPQPETVVCRCEDVSFRRMKEYDSWRGAKLQTRCGMGPCQGRICGAAAEFLLGWGMESVRPPVFPARVESLAVIRGAQFSPRRHGEHGDFTEETGDSP